MLSFLNLFTAMSLRDSMKPHATTTKQIGNNPGKISENLGKTHESLSKILENPGKNGAQRCLISQNGVQRLQKNT